MVDEIARSQGSAVAVKLSPLTRIEQSEVSANRITGGLGNVYLPFTIHFLPTYSQDDLDEKRSLVTELFLQEMTDIQYLSSVLNTEIK